MQGERFTRCEFNGAHLLCTTEQGHLCCFDVNDHHQSVDIETSGPLILLAKPVQIAHQNSKITALADAPWEDSCGCIVACGDQANRLNICRGPVAHSTTEPMAVRRGDGLRDSHLVTL